MVSICANTWLKNEGKISDKLSFELANKSNQTNLYASVSCFSLNYFKAIIYADVNALTDIIKFLLASAGKAS